MGITSKQIMAAADELQAIRDNSNAGRSQGDPWGEGVVLDHRAGYGEVADS